MTDQLNWPETLRARAVAHFHQDMLDGCQTLKRLGYWPGYFHRDVANDGGVTTVKKLLKKDGTSDGFTTLWELGRLDMSVEAFVLLPWYEVLFDDNERQVARTRLEAHRFNVDAFLRGLPAPPTWSRPE
jgi:hypothetical protein